MPTAIENRKNLIKEGNKSKRGKAKATIVSLLIDESGSMSSCRGTTIEGFNKYVKELTSQGGNVLMTLTKFNSGKVENVYVAKKINEVPALSEKTYSPEGGTPLFDAIGKTITKTEENKVMKNKPNVLFVIMTDGEENESREFNKKQITDLIKAKEKEGWTFVFLGANIDAFATGQSFGVHLGNTMQFDHTNIGTTFRDLARSTTVYASNATLNASLGSNYQTESFFKDKVKNKKDN